MWRENEAKLFKKKCENYWAYFSKTMMMTMHINLVDSMLATKLKPPEINIYYVIYISASNSTREVI
jgi:hypothetical protein